MPKRHDITKVLIIGSGPIVIGQACEFDYSGTQACKALRGLGYKIVLVNSNPATIMTDPGIANATYIEPLTVDSLERIIVKERPDALLPCYRPKNGLTYATVHKTRVKGRVTKIDYRTVFGTDDRVQAAFLASPCSRQVNTSYCFSKDWDVHRAATCFSMYSYNFCWAVWT